MAVTRNSVADIERFVAAGHSQSAGNCRVLIGALNEARAERNTARTIIDDLLGALYGDLSLKSRLDAITRARLFLDHEARTTTPSDPVVQEKSE